MPALATVSMPSLTAPLTFPSIVSYIVLYMPAPGTKGIRAQITKVVTGVFKYLAQISEYTLKIIEAINKDKILLIPYLVKNK